MNKEQICERLGMKPDVLVKLSTKKSEVYAAVVHERDPKVIFIYEENGKMKFKTPIKPIINNEVISLEDTIRAKNYFWNPETEKTLLDKPEKTVKVSTKGDILFLIAENKSGMSMYFPGSIPAVA